VRRGAARRERPRRMLFWAGPAGQVKPQEKGREQETFTIPRWVAGDFPNQLSRGAGLSGPARWGILFGMVALRLLAVLCCVNLALPPGWCSMAFRPRAEPTAPAKHGGCCDSCGCKDRKKAPPAAPQPVRPARCCCYELDWLKPPPPVSVKADQVPAAFLPPDEAVRPASGVWSPSEVIRGPSPPFHVLECVWLC
jgi:hypothetical protein